jgi:hypothetical protein
MRAALTMTLLTLLASAFAACGRKEPPATESEPAASSARIATAAPIASVAPTARSTSDRRVATPVVRDACRSICERSRQLQCKNTRECLSNCLGMASLTPCSEPISQFFQCLVGEPLEHWECDEDGIGSIREGYCDSEQARAVSCAETKL